jgi:hypothetical protein
MLQIDNTTHNTTHITTIQRSNVISTSVGDVAMNLQNEDIGAGIFLWSIISFVTTSMTVISGWLIWG